MPTTAKVRCQSSTTDGEQTTYLFNADYVTEDGRTRNAEWARYTPALHLSISVKPGVEFEVGKAYTLTFEPEPA